MARSARSPEQMPPQSAFARVAGIILLSATPEEVVCLLPVTADLANRNGMLHGGAMMTLADNAAGTAAFVVIKPEKTNTTIESKTNFLRGVAVGDTVRAVCVPLHLGRKTMVFQITMSRGDGKVAAISTQTHMVLDWDKQEAQR